MKLTIELSNATEVIHLLSAFKSLKMEGVKVIWGKGMSEPPEVRDDMLSKINHKLAKQLDLEELKKNKHYKGVNRVRFNKLVEEINLVEPIDSLLAGLS